MSMRTKDNTAGGSHEPCCRKQGQVRHPCVLAAELEAVTPKCTKMLHKLCNEPESHSYSCAFRMQGR